MPDLAHLCYYIIHSTQKNILTMMHAFSFLLCPRSLLGKSRLHDSEVLKQCRRAEGSLHALPCSWAWVDQQAWSSAEELVKVVRAHIFQEQTRIVWVEESDV